MEKERGKLSIREFEWRERERGDSDTFFETLI